MIAAEESVSTVYDVLAVDPLVIGPSAVLIDQCIFQVDIATPIPKRFRRYSSIISKEVVAPFRTQSTGETHERHLNGGGTCSKHLVPCTAGVSVQIDQNVDAIVDDLANQSLGRPIAGIVEHGRFTFDLLTMDGLIADRRGIAVSLHARRIVQTEHRLHQMRERVVIEV